MIVTDLNPFIITESASEHDHIRDAIFWKDGISGDFDYDFDYESDSDEFLRRG